MKPRYAPCRAIALFACAGLASADGPGEPDPAVPGQIIVRLAATADIDAFVAQCQADHPALNLGLTVVNAIGSESTYLLEFDPSGLSEAQLTQLEYDLQDGYLGTYLTWGGFAYVAQGPEGGTGNIWFFVPTNGPDLFPAQFAAATLGLNDAHLTSTGQGTVVAVLDTGIDATHPQLQGRVLAGGYNFIDNNGNTADVGNGVDDDGDGLVDELVGHGTFVASLVTLVAPDARILPVRVLNGDGVGSDWSVALGIQYAIDHGVEVINLSLSSTHESEIIEEAVERAADLGIVTVSAAGNFGTDIPQFPAVESPVLGVAAVDEQDVKASFSNYNEDLTIAAPGANANPGQPDPLHSIIGALPGGMYGMWEGTSFATALVSGGAALLRAQHPEWPNDAVSVSEIADTIEEILRETSVNIDGLNTIFADQLGEGRMDLAEAVTAGPSAPTPGDLDNDGSIGILDFLAMLADWNLTHSSADLDGDGTVGILDVLILLGNWAV